MISYRYSQTMNRSIALLFLSQEGIPLPVMQCAYVTVL